MNHEPFKLDLYSFLFLLLLCFCFSFIHVGLSHLSVILEYIFIAYSAGLFFFGGKNFIQQGAFKSKKWIIVFVIFIPVTYQLDVLLIDSIDWYLYYGGFAYYIMFALRYTYIKLRNKKL